MLFCPECEEEFPDTSPTCSECNVELVSSLREEEFPELAVVCTILNEANAYIIRGFLESENIPCQLENISFHAGPAPVADLMKVRLWGKKEDVGRARKLLEERQGVLVCSACETETTLEDEACSHCGEKLN
jgi:predicted amidophosphoribosyltransferase